MKVFATIKELQKALASKEITTSEIVEFYRARIAKYNPKVNAIVETFDKASDETASSGPLSGIPGVIKDNICQKGRITSCASNMLKNYKAPYDATVNVRLKAAGTSILGRTNMDEFAMGSTGENSIYGASKNPWDLTRSPGGSSAGSAAAVAAGLAPWALGTETGGSVRQPAAFCGLVGLYPTYGLFSRYGVVAFTSSTDQVGPLTKTVYDNALITSIISGHDPLDSTSISKPKRDLTKSLNGKFPKNLTIGVLDSSFGADAVDPEITQAFQNAIAHLEKNGVKIKRLSLPYLKYGNAVYFVLSRAEAASNLYRFDGSLYGHSNREGKDLFDMYRSSRTEGFSKEVKRRILLGNYVLSASHHDKFYAKATQVRALIREDFSQAFRDVDALITPVTSTLPFKLGDAANQDPLKVYMGDCFTVPMCVAGIPSLSLPCGFSKEGLPIGFQFVGPQYSEQALYEMAHAYEQSTDFHLKNPQGFE
jgi:aspartyl-tRNA(Asn)/glutamyl-tRNA(Gln) amidotransferase subunit A